VKAVIPALCRAVDESAPRVRSGGRVFYVGAGTSGRLGVVDAAEIPPTFGVPPELVQAVLCGGYEACYTSAETSEDDAQEGERRLRDRGCAASDVVVGIAASGSTPFTLGAVAWARSAGALTVGISCDPDSALARISDIPISPVVGPEVIAGSTRMKSGTAQKMVLNMFSTGLMVRLGHVYSHWMVNVEMKNAKLKKRGLRILREATGASESACRAAVSRSGGNLRVALVMMLSGSGPEQARGSLQANGWELRKAVRHILGGTSK
jgi:N-acetylmuramic acid 6-phosphate etherase